MPIARNLRHLVCLPKDVCFLVRSTSSNLRLRRMNTSAAPPSFTTLLYSVSDRVANIQLNRPERMNAINEHMPGEIQAAVKLANDNKDVKVIILSGTKVFCSGYDLKQFAESERGTVPGNQTMPWDPYIDFQLMDGCNSAFMSLWRSYKPVICKINGVAIGGGSDMALVCDLTVAAEDARIGYPPSRVFGCPTTAMWVYRVGIEKAKRILLTGDILTGRQAADIGLIGEAVPADQLDQAVDRLVQRLVTVPTNQMFFQKQVINNAVEMMGLFSSQRLATFIDGMTRHTPEGVAFTERARAVGFKQAVKERDMGREADWSTMGKAKL